MITEILTQKELHRAVSLVKNGGLVAFPTETVYGLGAPIYSEKMIKKIFKIKGRPSDNPLIAHVASLKQCQQIAMGPLPKIFYSLVEAFFPGPLTLVVKKNSLVPSCVSAGLNTIALRMPNHFVALDFISALNSPLVAPSANISGRPSSTSVAHVLEDFNGKIAAVIDGGLCTYGIESTVLDIVSFDAPTLLRPGSISKEELEKVIKLPISFYKKGPKGSPGMKYRHYTPRTKVKFFDLQKDLESYLFISKNALLLSTKPLKQNHLLLTSKNLYASLRMADQMGYDEILIYCEQIEDLALINRLDHIKGE